MPLEAAQVIRGPYVQSAAADRMTVCWRTDVATTSELSYGLSADALGTPVVGPDTRTDHAVTLTGLQPATRYYYRLQGTPTSGNSVNVEGTDYWFKTSPPAGDAAKMRMWVIGDSGSNLVYAAYVQYYATSVSIYQAYLTATATAGKETDLWMMLGDNAYTNGTDPEYQISVFDKYPALLRNSALWPAIGNHDISSIGYPWEAQVPYDSIMTLPTAGECGGVPSGSTRYFSFDRGNVHFICLDSCTPVNYKSTVGSGGMKDWLIADLKATSATWIIAFFHHAPYSRGSHFSDSPSEMTYMRRDFGPILEDYGVDLVLAGHSHVYERSGFISGHYGTSETWNESLRRQSGNGSDLGGVTPEGLYIIGQGQAQGAYQKPMAIGNSGSVYAVVGTSGSIANWGNTSDALVNPNPHPAHVVSLRLMGGLTVEIDGPRMNCQFLDHVAAVKDDFTIIKGPTYTLQPAVPTTQGELSGVAFPVTRTGSTAFAENVPVGVTLISGSGVTPSQAVAVFAAGQSSTEVKFFPAGSDAETVFQAQLLSTTKTVQPGATPRAAYRIAGGPQIGYFGPTDPMTATTWYILRFGAPPPSSSVWDLDDDGDGLSLLLEYALGGEPGPNDSALLPQGVVEGGSFIYRYTRPPGRSDLSYEILGSADLSSWPLPALSDVNDGPVTALGEPRKVELPVGGSLRFIKMKIEMTP